MTGPVKAFLKPEKGENIECMFNPAELTIAKANSWAAGEAKGVNAPELRFQTGQSGTMTMSLTLDTTDKGTDVTDYTNRLLALMRVDPTLPASDPQSNSGRPPWVEFHWGKLISFRAVVERLQMKFTYFASNGTPLRAKADMTLKQYSDGEVWGLQNPTSSTPAPHSLHQVQPGETLDRIAAAYYRDGTRWRLIAEANRIIDPLALPVGAVLVIPEPPAVGRG
jgi:Contractile injection system tube protein/LysM domain